MSAEGEWFLKYLQRFEGDIKEIKSCIERMPETLERKYVTKVEFWPVQKLIYGLVALALAIILGGLLRMVTK